MPQELTSRKNATIVRLRALAADGAFRRAEGEYVCDGEKLLREALDKGAELRCVLWKERAQTLPGLEGVAQFVAPAELFDYASPMKNSPGPLFTLAIPPEEREAAFERAILLENVQDPGNVGTILRSAAAMGVGTVILCGACADPYTPRRQGPPWARSSVSGCCICARRRPRSLPEGTGCRSTARRSAPGRGTCARSIFGARSSPSEARGAAFRRSFWPCATGK